MVDSPGALADAVIGGDRTALARAITLVESAHPADRQPAEELLERILPHTGRAVRVGISGVPGVGKSTLIESLGLLLCGRGSRVAVLAVDPSSTRTGGSILGDKARMNRLAQDERAFIRPSPTARTLGGVARRTREALLLCEAAGHDVVLVETVGVGQSETAVAELVDTLVLLLLPGAGDELQGIKRGVVEFADVLAVNKADGEGLTRAQVAAAEVRAAIGYQRERLPGWRPPVLLVSGLASEGLSELWDAVLAHRAHAGSTGALERNRAAQRASWLAQEIESRLAAAFELDPDCARERERIERDVVAGKRTVATAAAELVAAFLARRPDTPRHPQEPWERARS